MRPAYFAEMAETSANAAPLVRERLVELASHAPEARDAVWVIGAKRTREGQLLLRPHLVRLGYELAGGSPWTNVLDACAGAELLNISTYQANVALDGKAGVTSLEDRASQFMCAMLTLGAAHSVFASAAERLAPEQEAALVGDLVATNTDIYRGQVSDSSAFRDLHEISGLGLEGYWSRYRARCELLGGTLIAFCLTAGARLAGADPGMLAQLADIGRRLGTAGQMANDFADAVPARLLGRPPNCYRDHGSDMRNGRLTYALADLVISSPARIPYVTALLHRAVSDGEQRDLFATLCAEGCVTRLRRRLAAFYYPLKRQVRLLPASRPRAMLSVALSAILTNRYLAAAREFQCAAAAGGRERGDDGHRARQAG